MDYTKKPAGAYYTSPNNKKWYEARNAEMYKDKLSGMSNADLVAKYGITQQAIRNIIKREEARNANK